MMKIRYNIADKKKMNYLRFYLILGALAVLALGFILLGAMSLAATAKQFEDKKAELKTYDDKLQETTQKNKEQKNEIETIKKKWNNERKFVNGLIEAKNFSFLELLGQLEKILPAGVFIGKLALNTDSGSRVQLTIYAVSSAKLAEAYKAFWNYSLSVQKEFSGDGVYKADLQLKLE